MRMVENVAGFYGDYGGCFVPDRVAEVLRELEEVYIGSMADEEFRRELDYYYRQYIGRPNPLYFAANLTRTLGGAKIYLKREDLNHTGAHKINNTIGQVLLARKMGKRRVVAETGAGQHGVATATACALFGMECVIYQGQEDIRRQALNVYRMELLGAKVIPVTSGQGTLKEAVDAAFIDLVENVDETFYMLGSAVGPHPYPAIVRDFQSVIGREAREQIIAQEGRLPDHVLACVGGGSNAIGIFHPFVNDTSVELVGIEPAGCGLGTGRHAATLTLGKPGQIHGFRCYLLSDETGEPALTHSVAAGLDYPGVGPEHCYYRDSGRARYTSVTDEAALAAFKLLSRAEGIIPALESAHAIAEAARMAPSLDRSAIIIVNLSGRGDKDVAQVREMGIL